MWNKISVLKKIHCACIPEIILYDIQYDMKN